MKKPWAKEKSKLAPGIVFFELQTDRLISASSQNLPSGYFINETLLLSAQYTNPQNRGVFLNDLHPKKQRN